MIGGPEKITDFPSRLIFAYLQYLYVKNIHPEWLKMLDKVLRCNLDVNTIVWDISLDWDLGNACWIDHQSCSSEDENTEIFDNEDALTQFLFGDSSYIQLDNDNH